MVYCRELGLWAAVKQHTLGGGGQHWSFFAWSRCFVTSLAPFLIKLRPPIPTPDIHTGRSLGPSSFLLFFFFFALRTVPQTAPVTPTAVGYRLTTVGYSSTAICFQPSSGV